MAIPVMGNYLKLFLMITIAGFVHLNSTDNATKSETPDIDEIMRNDKDLEPTQRKGLRFHSPGTGTGSDWNFCTLTGPCGLGRGDCDDDTDCAGDLMCGLDNCKSFNPAARRNADCCVARVTGFDFAYWDYCKTHVCDLGMGDCDNDAECSGSLVCGKDNCKDFHGNPATFDGEALGDCCINPTLADCWTTSWLDRDNPSGNGDGEQFQSQDSVFKGCQFYEAEIEQIQIHVVGKPYHDYYIYQTAAEVLAGTGDFVHITDMGMYCVWRFGEQPDNQCEDYEVRILCCQKYGHSRTV